MTRYVIRATPAKAEWWNQPPLLPHLTVDGRKEVDTGLVDQHGQTIMRIQPPVGFGRE